MFALVPIVLVLWVGKMIGSQMNFFAVILASLFALPQVFDALSIFVRCSELGTIGAAQCPWSSFDDFMYDPWGWIFRGGLMVGVVAWSRMVWKVRKQGAENSPAS